MTTKNGIPQHSDYSEVDGERWRSIRYVRETAYGEVEHDVASITAWALGLSRQAAAERDSRQLAELLYTMRGGGFTDQDLWERCKAAADQLMTPSPLPDVEPPKPRWTELPNAGNVVDLDPEQLEAATAPPEPEEELSEEERQRREIITLIGQHQDDGEA